jgi:hypothetical protein
MARFLTVHLEAFRFEDETGKTAPTLSIKAAPVE